MNEKQFPEGIRIYAPHEKAPDFIVADVVINRSEFAQYMRSFEGDQIPLQIKRSKKSGKMYFDLNTYRLQNNNNNQKPASNDDDFPF